MRFLPLLPFSLAALLKLSGLVVPKMMTWRASMMVDLPVPLGPVQNVRFLTSVVMLQN